MPTQQLRQVELAVDCYIRQSQLIPGILPFSSPTLWRKIKAGQFPKPIKLSARITAWRTSDIQDWLAQQGAAARDKPKTA